MSKVGVYREIHQSQLSAGDDLGGDLV
jgi:hypothetical protein